MYYYKQGTTYIASRNRIPATEISAEEYNCVKSVIDNRPTAPEGFAYRLTENLVWELYELPAEETDPELTAAEAPAIITGGDTGA